MLIIHIQIQVHNFLQHFPQKWQLHRNNNLRFQWYRIRLQFFVETQLLVVALTYLFIINSFVCHTFVTSFLKILFASMMNYEASGMQLVFFIAAALLWEAAEEGR